MTENPYAPPKAAQLALPEESAPALTPQAVAGPVGLGGWLILPLLGLALSSVRLLFQSFSTFAPLIANGTWHAITTPGSEDFRPALAALIVAEWLLNTAFAVAQIYLLTLAFRRRRQFARLYMLVLLSNIGFILLDMLAGYLLVPGEPLFDADSTKELMRTLFASAIWVPYMLRSVRVRNTFTH